MRHRRGHDEFQFGQGDGQQLPRPLGRAVTVDGTPLGVGMFGRTMPPRQAPVGPPLTSTVSGLVRQAVSIFMLARHPCKARYSLVGCRWMIRSFGDTATEALFHGRRGCRSLSGPTSVERALGSWICSTPQNAYRICAIRHPGQSSRQRLSTRVIAACTSIRINDQWRVIFRWEGSDAGEVQIVDYPIESSRRVSHVPTRSALPTHPGEILLEEFLQPHVRDPPRLPSPKHIGVSVQRRQRDRPGGVVVGLPRHRHNGCFAQALGTQLQSSLVEKPLQARLRPSHLEQAQEKRGATQTPS